ncbi:MULTISPECIES: hypothetical protein [Brevibacillus]|nr:MULTISPECIES: hypothetical protein [Brevibacillus]MED1948959.1 hypothetical protein [Brevibacillus formosus]MED2001764.1 hypothetical protein [Brevibacillus formosus]MED2084587.1 hypothetical protein [Brevibacillus formosus]WGV60489.1 hypothetical protein QIH01_04985 [Brevibacillus brevis]
MKKWLLSICVLSALFVLPVSIDHSPAKKTVIQYGWPETGW